MRQPVTLVDMVANNADAYYRYEYAIQECGATLPDDAIDYLLSVLTTFLAPYRTASPSGSTG